MDAGYDISSSDLLSRIKENDMDVTLSGGDPLFQAKKLLPLLKAIRESGFTIWCYTGFTYESIAERPEIKPLLELIDVLVDGPFIKKLRDTALLFRGSSNQRLIDLRKSSPDNIVLWTPDF
jgi:anaerobic ribonucleoside-triphosphate reductase activating protein